MSQCIKAIDEIHIKAKTKRKKGGNMDQVIQKETPICYSSDLTTKQKGLWLEAWERQLKRDKECYKHETQKHLKNIFSMMFMDAVGVPSDWGWDDSDVAFFRKKAKRSLRDSKIIRFNRWKKKLFNFFS